MHICFLAPANSIHTIKWINAFSDRGYQVSLITNHKPSGDKINPRVKIYVLPIPAPLGYYLNIFKVKWILKKINPDILHTHYATGYGTLSRLVDYNPTVLSVWGSDVFEFPNQSESNRKLLEKNLRAATRIASTSLVMKEETLKYVNPLEPIAITPFGVDMEQFKPDETKVHEGSITIGMIKTFEKIYGAEYLIRATRILLDRLKAEGYDDTASQVKLLLVGKGSQVDYLKDLADKLGISHCIEFTGAVPHHEVPQYLTKIDIYCAPSLMESFGVAVIEASAAGVPVIVSDAGGLPEVVENDITGFIVNKENEHQLAEKLFVLVMDPEKRRKFGIDGREFVRRNYNWDSNVSIMEKLYQDIVKDQ